jgi:hypothetical protein
MDNAEYITVKMFIKHFKATKEPFSSNRPSRQIHFGPGKLLTYNVSYRHLSAQKAIWKA